MLREKYEQTYKKQTKNTHDDGDTDVVFEKALRKNTLILYPIIVCNNKVIIIVIM